MKVAFLFEKKYPAYDLAFRLIQTIPVEDREEMDTQISTGFWGLNECAESLGLRHLDQIVTFVARLIHNQEGSLTRVVSDESIIKAVRGDIFAVIIHSIGRSLTLRLHEGLKSTEQYRGMIQILPHLAVHRQIFGFCPPTMRLENKSLFIWSSEDVDQHDEDDEEARLAQEVVTWARKEHPLLGLKVQTKAVGFKGSILDEHSENAFVVQQNVQEMVEKWTEITEHVIYKLNDFAPDVVEELTSALKGLGKRKLTAAECGQVAVNLRRSLELLANVLSAGNPERLADVQSMPGPQQEKYKQLLWRYLDDQFPNNYYVGKDIEHELKNVDTLLNKGVHEHWLMTMIRPLAIRTVLVMNSLLFPVKAGVVQLRVGDDLFR